MSRLYIFHHVFKTGGTTFNLSYVPGAFDPEEVFVLRGSAEPNRDDVRRAREFSTEQRARLKLIAGHNTGELRDAYPCARFLSLARDPAARSISAYLHCKHHEDSWELTGRRIEEENISLAAFVEADWFQKANNLQTKLLLGPECLPLPPKNDGEMTAAIRSRFYAVGYTEALELFLFFLHISEAFPLVLFNNRLVRKERATFRPTEEDLNAIERHNRLDSALYRCVRQEFDRKVAQVWTKDTEHLYNEYLAALESYRNSTQGSPYAVPIRWQPQGRAKMATRLAES